MKNTNHIAVLILLLIFVPFLCPVTLAAPLSATAVVERADLFVGESFIFQIQVSGSEDPEKPDLSHVADFTVEFRGGQQNSSRSVRIVNGRVAQDVREGYVFSYQLTPKRAGRLTIPPVTVSADGQSTRTKTVAVNAKKPVETDDFKLTLKLSRNHCYVGEPVTLTVTWYIGKDVKNFNFTLPLLNDDTFHFINPEVDMQSGKKLYRIPLGGDEVIGEKGRGRVGDRDFATITFRKILIAKQPGEATIEPATVACNALVGYRKQRGFFDDDFLSDFFNDDFFGRSRRGIYKTVVVPSNSLRLSISELPESGRPDNFAGHVGEYLIHASATPTEVSVGDPITLKVVLSGPDFLEHVKLPPLSLQSQLARDFKIPKERAVGELSNKSKVFTQTIRALRPEVKEIPPIELPYFDTKTGAYSVARTEPIPLNVKETRVVTAQDAEGVDEQVSLASEIETWAKGIAFNYEDRSVIQNQRFGPISWLKSPLLICLTTLPPIAYFLLLAGIGIARRRSADPFAARARKAYGNLTKSLKDARRAHSSGQVHDIVLDAFRNYLGDKLRMPKGALTFNDVKDKLATKGMDAVILDQLKELFETCEAGCYAGASCLSDAVSITEKGLNLAKNLEKKLK